MSGKNKDSVVDRMKGWFKELVSDDNKQVPAGGEITYITPQLLGAPPTTPHSYLVPTDPSTVTGFPHNAESLQKYGGFLNANHPGSYLVLNLTKSKYDYSAFNDQGNNPLE